MSQRLLGSAVMTVLVAVLLLSGCAGDPVTDAEGAPAKVTPALFADAVATPATFVLNVHTPDEGSIAGTDASIPFDRLRERADELPADKSRSIAVYCRSGNMSSQATVTLTDLGYSDVVELEGGMEAWRADGRTLLPPG